MKCRLYLPSNGRLYLNNFLQLKSMSSSDNRGEGRGRVLLGRVRGPQRLRPLQHDQRGPGGR